MRRAAARRSATVRASRRCIRALSSGVSIEAAAAAERKEERSWAGMRGPFKRQEEGRWY